MTASGRLRRLLAGPRVTAPRAPSRAEDRDAVVRAALLVRIFYLALFFIDLTLSENWSRWLKTTTFDLLWPLKFFQLTGTRAGVGIVIAGSIGSALLAAIFPERRAARVLAAVGLLLYGAFWNSFGIVMHGWHAWIWCAFIFCFLPDQIISARPNSRRREQSFLRIFWVAQACVLLFYSLAGAFKLAGAVWQIAQGKYSAFGPEALARHVAYALGEGSHHFVFSIGPWIADHPFVAWPFFLIALYLESCSLIAAFRPGSHRIWGILLIGFHVGIYLSMEILFSWQMLLVGLMLICSPFDRATWTLADRVRSLPLVGELLAMIHRRRVPADPLAAPIQSPAEIRPAQLDIPEPEPLPQAYRTRPAHLSRSRPDEARRKP